LEITILGSTGSIGTQTLDVVKNINLDKKIKIKALSTYKNIDLLEKQILEFKPEFVCVVDKNSYIKLTKKKYNAKILYGVDGLIEIAKLKVDLVINAISGFDGLLPTMEIIRAKNNIALANKESLVAAGDLVMREAKENNINIIPIDSEHSAIFEMINQKDKLDINKIYITASGGPFNKIKFNNSNDLDNIKVDDALKHPTWKMGKKISIDSATLINKGFEVLEAFWLFDIPIEKIKVVVHPQSLIHSMVEFSDGSINAYLATNDMRLPIQCALTYPKIIKNNLARLNFEKIKFLSFEELNKNLIGIDLCKEALKIGGTMPAVLCVANDIAVNNFLNNNFLFSDIYKFISFAMKHHKVILNYKLSDILNIKKQISDLVIKFKEDF
jgi:1-deoxy-D-xylulose-5-phosphate reductoisomerase